MHFYAQINEAGICMAVAQTTLPSLIAAHIAIGSLDVAYIGRTYSGGSWV